MERVKSIESMETGFLFLSRIYYICAQPRLSVACRCVEMKGLGWGGGGCQTYKSGSAHSGSGDDAAQGFPRLVDPLDGVPDGGRDALGVGDVAHVEAGLVGAELLDEGGAVGFVHVEDDGVAARGDDVADAGAA